MGKYIVYKTTNLLDKKFYIGKTTLGIQNDKYYFGSGTYLLRAIKLYGKENFSRETLYEFDNEEDAYKKEEELLTTDLLESTECYNIKQGGKGGWKHSLETINKIKEGRKKQKFSEETKKKMSEAKVGIAQVKVTCPHCGKTGGNSSMRRWHFDNCSKKQMELDK